MGNNLTKPGLEISYALPPGGLPAQSERLSDRAVFTTAYAFIPSTVMTDIVTSALPFWEQTRLWVLARPLSGFAETFSHYLMEVGPNGGSDRPDDDADDGGGDSDDDDEDLRLSFLYIQTPDQPPPRPLC